VLALSIVFLLVLFNGFFAMSEMAVLTSRKSRLKQMATTSRGAAKALKLAEHPESFLSAVQLWISLLSLLLGFFGGEQFGDKIALLFHDIPVLSPYAKQLGFAGGFLVMLFLFGLIGELVPKRIGTLRPEQIASAVAYPMEFFAWIATPFVRALATSTRVITRVIGLGDSSEAAVTEEEIRLLVTEGHEQGVIDADERNMMNRVMRLGDRTADSLMTPRMRIVWLDAAADREENLQTMRETPYSRYPVFRGNDSEVIGVLEVKTLLDELGRAEPELFRDIRPAVFVSESTHVLKLLEIFREEQQSLALVVDEYGEIQGMVTVADVMGAILGRVQAGEGGGEDAPLVTMRDDGSLLVDGTLPVDDLRELLGGISLPDLDDMDYYTAAGMVIAHFGRIPNVGEHFDWHDWRIEVVDLDGPRVDKLLLQQLAQGARDE